MTQPNRSLSAALLAATVAVLMVGSAPGCESTQANNGPDYQTIADYPNRDTPTAQQENAAAVQLLKAGEFEQAQQRIKAALKADVTYGPAHNNLGKIYYLRGNYYLAAWEFRYAIKLMPHQPEPLNNLGLVFEAVGKLDDAVAQYDKALLIQPDNPQIIGNSARARYRRGDRGDEIKEILSQLILKDTRPAWTQWARQKLALMRPIDPPPAP